MAVLAVGSFVLVVFVCGVTVRAYIAFFHPQRTMWEGRAGGQALLCSESLILSAGSIF